MENRCVCCGGIIPEGRQICSKCEQGTKNKQYSITKEIIEKLHLKKKDFRECLSNEETKLVREWNKAVNVCIDVVKKYV